jgi:VWFA-related protein
MTTRGFAAAVVLIAGLSAAARGAQTDAVHLDVIVTDVKARPIPSLKAADFEIIDAGNTQTVEDVHLKTGGGRVVGIFLDEYHVQSGDGSARARAALTRFVSTSLRDGDEVAVMKPLDPLNGIAFSQDRQGILNAISTFEGRRGDFTARSPFEEQFMSRSAITGGVARAQVVASALQALARRLGEKGSGRRALIVVSEGFTAPMPRAIILAANRQAVAIYPVDPHVGTQDDESGLRVLAEQTGGEASINQADLAPGLAQAVADLDTHYVVTYRPAKHDGRFHPIEVRVTRSGAHARARSGYWAAARPDSTASSARSNAVTLPFRPSHSSPYIRPWIGMSRGADGQTNVTVAWEAGTAPPRNQRIASIALKAMGPDGRVLFQKKIGPGDRSRATFDAPPGYIALEMALQSSTGAALDTDYRGISVPNLYAPRPTFGTPQVLRTRTARSFAEATADAEAIPAASRTFSRAERLVIRIPAYGPDNAVPVVRASLLNRRGVRMRELDEIRPGLPGGIAQFDLILANLAPDEYRVELTAANAEGTPDEVRELVVFRVTN